MDWFKKIFVEEYEDLIKNKNKMYIITKNFSTPEILNKYRDEDDNINRKIQNNERQIIQNENLSKVFDKNLNKYFNEKEDTLKYDNTYPLKSNIDIANSFNKIFNDYNLNYSPKSNTNKVKTRYLLNKLEKSKKVSNTLFNYFDSNIRNMKKLNLYLYLNRNKSLDLYDENSILQLEEPTVNELPEENADIIPIQHGHGYNNIEIDEDALNKNILKIRYLNGQKLDNKLLKHDYKISKNMKDAVKFNKNITNYHKMKKTFIMKLKNI